MKVFKDEWTELGGNSPADTRRARVKAGLKQLGGVERLVPIVFALLYIVMFIGRLVG